MTAHRFSDVPLNGAIRSTHSIQLCVCQHALDAPLESSAGLWSRLWRTPSAPESGFGCKNKILKWICRCF